jgi:plasmid stability protein
MEAAMAQILVRNLDDRLKTSLQQRARRNRRSMEAEAREILRDALREKEVPQYGLGTEIANLFRGVGLEEGEEIREIRGFHMEVPKFEP